MSSTTFNPGTLITSDWLNDVNDTVYIKITQTLSGNFWPELGGKINRLADRVFVGDAVEGDGSIANVVKDWLETERQYTTRNSQFATLSTIGQIAMIGGSRTSDSLDAGSMGCIGVAGYAINNNTTQVQTAYAGYFEARRKAGAGITHGIELDIVNEGSVVTINPYIGASVGATLGLWLASGGEVAGATTASLALGIIKNGAQFEKGIMFAADAILGTDGVTGTGVAMALAKGHMLQWYGAGGAGTGYILNDVATAALSTNLRFNDEGAAISGNTSQKLALVPNVVGAVNYAKVLASITGGAVKYGADGSDANIDVFLDPKGGVFGVTYGSDPATSAPAFVASRRLAFKDGNNILWYIPVSTVAW